MDISEQKPIYGGIQEHIRSLLDTPNAVSASRITPSGGAQELMRNERPLGQVLNENLDDLDPMSKRALLWREEGLDPDRIHSTEIKENHFEFRLRGVPDLPRFLHHETWSARSAALMHELMIPYFADERASFLFNIVKSAPDLMVHRWLEDINEAEDSNLSPSDVHTGGSTPELKLWSIYDSTIDLAADLGRRWADNNFLLSLADTAFMDLLGNMADRAPKEPLHPDELIAADGALFFRQPILRSDLVGEDDEPMPIRGISWFSHKEQLHIMLLSDAGGRSYAGGHIDDRIKPYLKIATIGEIEFGHNIDDIESQTLANLMRSLLHLSQSPIVSNERIQHSAKKKKKHRNKNRSAQTVDITYLSLRPVEQSLRQTTPTGTTPAHSEHHTRRHMARGHWRNQWYPSLQEHRVIWIDEHWRGDADIGIVNGKTIYIARGD